MKSTSLSLFGALLLSLFACAHPAPDPSGGATLLQPGEVHFKSLRQLTAGGTNAEAYWSFDGKHLSYQHKGGVADPEPECDQIYSIRADGSEKTRISNGRGRTTCSYYLPGDSRILYSSTFKAGAACPAKPDMSKGYVWPIYSTYQMYTSPAEASLEERKRDVVPMEPGAPSAYNAEATVCKDGSVVFTSDRDGDLEMYVAKLEKGGTLKGIKRITHTPGYDGGAFFSQDCSKLVWRASRPRVGKELNEYQTLLKRHLVKPGALEIWLANADGSHARQLTRMGSASFAPSFTPDNQAVVFASNPRDPRGRGFDLYKINVNGTGLERVTFSNTFESFPLFSPDGKWVAFSSNRNAKEAHETNVFVAEWTHPATIPSENLMPTAADRFHATVATLSSPEMEGRAPGTPGLEKAEAWVEGRYKELGLKPFFGESYRQAVDVKGKTGHNLVGSWGPGCAKGARALMIGAHLDHLGLRDKDGVKIPYAGADDNASGVAGMLEVARALTLERNFDATTCLLFAAFTGEEEGIIGSNALAAKLKADHVPLKAMINLDMIGRMENNKLYAIGSDSAREWTPVLQKTCADKALDCTLGGDGYGPSDMMAFYQGKTPVLFFFTGSHQDHHQTSDTIEKINATGAAQAIEVVVAAAREALRSDRPFRFVKSRTPPKLSYFHTTGEQGYGSGGKSSGAYLGTVPDYSMLGQSADKLPKGVKIADVRTGSPAEKAGVKAGDLLKGIDDAKIERLEDFMSVLRTLKPGQKITLTLVRDGAPLKLPAEVGKRE
jgi:Tol biopolymer transport system component